MIRYIIVSVAGGLFFGVLDGLINGNPYARKLYEVFQPISKASIDYVTGIAIDLVFGFVMSGIFLILYKSLPGGTGIKKGISFALFAWFFRVVMSVASQWVMFNVPLTVLLYTLCTGFLEMLIIGIFYGLTIKH